PRSGGPRGARDSPLNVAHSLAHAKSRDHDPASVILRVLRGDAFGKRQQRDKCDMRVIAGTLKGRQLKAPKWEGLRPTSDKLRETLFNVLAARVPGARVLDGYAGTGAVGIEALSRGAAHVTFLEQDRRAAALIEENLAQCGVENGYAIIRAPAGRAVA